MTCGGDDGVDAETLAERLEGDARKLVQWVLVPPEAGLSLTPGCRVGYMDPTSVVTPRRQMSLPGVRCHSRVSDVMSLPVVMLVYMDPAGCHRSIRVLTHNNNVAKSAACQPSPQGSRLPTDVFPPVVSYAELSVTLCSDEHIRSLNQEWRGGCTSCVNAVES